MINYLKNWFRTAFLVLGFIGIQGLLFSQVPQGAINGVFKVSDNTFVYFSRGNLQYIGSASTPYWKFAEHQWDYLGTTTGQNSAGQNVARDLFGWGTSGYNHGAVCYQPWSTSTTNSDYYAYGAANYNLYDQSGQADWGYNAILNGGNQENSGWRTLTKKEWAYVFNTRTTASGIRYAKAKVNGVNGVILLPDAWSTSYYSLNNTNQGNASFDSNTISASQWSTLEQHGAVFLPAAGYRHGTGLVSLVGSYGYYWSAKYENGYNAYRVDFGSSGLNPGSWNTRNDGHSVRLVRSAQSYSINASPSPTAGGAVSGGGTYSLGASCTLTATANTGYTFVNWTENGAVVSTNANYSFTVNSNRTLVANFESGSSHPGGVLNGVFKVSNGSWVFFSQGNLQYIGSASTPYWKFAEHQWEYLGTTTGQNSADQNVARDIYGWGTSGYNHGAVCYQPWSTSTPESDYYAYGAANYNLYDQSGQADWGYNAILNGGNQENSGWRTLTKNEWAYVFNIRTTASGIRYAKAKVNDVNGVILLPDDWSTSYYSLNNTNQGNASFDSNTISASQWSTLEQHGAAFLPAAGYRFGTSVYVGGSDGYYWSASYIDSVIAFNVYFNSSGFNPQHYNNRCFGLYVRLVRSAQNYSINASPSPTAGGAVSGVGTYFAGADCTLTATANPGYTFVNWTENGTPVSTNATYTFTVTSDRTLVANFSLNSYQITATVNPSAGGTVTGAGAYNHGSTATLTATANTGYTFVNWTENGTPLSTNATYTFTVTSDRTLVANFSLNSYQITATVNPSAGGTVTGAGAYNHGSTATLTATANTGYTFVNWTENGTPVSANATYSFTVNADRTLVANFSLNSYQVTVSTNPSAGGSVAGGGTFNYGETATVTATANTGYQFINWTQNGTQVSASATYSFTVTGNANLVANFGTEGYLVTATANPAEGGVVTGANTYTYGSTAVLTATANTGYTFVNWTENGNLVSTNATYSFTVTGNRSLVANFVQSTYQITAEVNPENGGTILGAGTYSHGVTAALTVIPNTGFMFGNWTKDGIIVSTETTYSFTVTEAGHYVANLYEVTNVDELSTEGFTLYPNPADNILVIEGPSETNSCEIYNLTGLLVYKEMDCQQKMEINTSRLPSGAYLVKLVSDGKVFTRKFMKK